MMNVNHKRRDWGLPYGIVSIALCTSITIGGCSRAIIGSPPEQEAPAPAESAPVVTIPMEPEINAADLWSDDRSRIDTPLVSVGLEAETQWAIFGICGQDAKLFCSAMAIAEVESGFDTDLLGDGGDSIGMMQINTRWHTGRMEALGVTDLTDPVQCATVAIDYLLELEDIMGAGPDDHALYLAYNMGPSGAKRAIRAGTSSTEYSTAVMEAYRKYIAEMEAMV